MKKLIVLLPAIVLALSSYAQPKSEYAYLYDNNTYRYTYFPKQDDQMIKKNHVKEMTELNKKDKIIMQHEYDKSYKLSGLIQYFWSFGKLHGKLEVSYQGERTVPITTYSNAKGKVIKKYINTYNIDTLLTEQNKYKRGKLAAKVIYKYDSKRLTEIDYYNKNETQPQKKWIYEYYPDHSRKSSTLYKKGKIKYVWHYECKQEGELLKKHKDTTMICRNVETDKDSNRTVTLRQFDEKGKPCKYVYVYNKKKEMIEQRYYDDKDVLRHKYIKKADNFSSIWSNYDKHGKEVFRWEYIYNSKNKLIEFASYKKNNIPMWKTVYKYNDKDQRVSSMTTGKKSRFLSKEENTYDEHDLLTVSKTMKKNGKLSYQTKYKYLFY